MEVNICNSILAEEAFKYYVEHFDEYSVYSPCECNLFYDICNALSLLQRSGIDLLVHTVEQLFRNDT